MAAFVIPDHNNARFFNGPLGNSGVEEIAIQQGITVLLEQSGDAGSPGSLPSLYSSNDNVASISKTTSSGRSSQRFTLFAKNSGAAVLNGEEPKSKDDCVFPLHVIVGDYQHHADPWVGGSRLVYKGGIGRAGETDKCFYMGLFKSDTTNPRGPVLRQDDSTFGDYDELGFLEVINGPL